jgi:aspartate-semialdehyde dehydrogenase
LQPRIGEKELTMKIALVGATGLVGSAMLEVLSHSSLPIEVIYPVASERSLGKKISFKEKLFTVISVEEAIAAKPDLALFSAGSESSLKDAPRFAEAGIRVIDNSSAWRMDPGKKLVVPEINGHTLGDDDWIIANPNCSTIQMVMVLGPLHKEFELKRIVVSTYQSITGTGYRAVQQMNQERKGEDAEMVYPYRIDMNCIPQCDVFLENDYTKEEMKLVNETRKILGTDRIGITATAVRVPVMGGHSESVNAEFTRPVSASDARKVLESAPGVVVYDQPSKNIYPMPLLSSGRDEVFVGRLRNDDSIPNTLNMWIVADNLRKGAATNAVQIAEYLYHHGLIGKQIVD